MKVLAHSKWDTVPAICGFLHFAYILTFFTLFPVAPWWALICMGIIYSVSISWNINGISHNFLHNPYFAWRPLNRVFGVIESLALGFSQTFYKYVHHRHHMGNSDRLDEHGNTVDWLSIYRHGHATTRHLLSLLELWPFVIRACASTEGIQRCPRS